MPMPQQLPQIPILRTRHPDFREVIFSHQPEQESGILAVVLLLLHALGLDLRGIADPQLEIKFCQQPLKPAGKSRSLHTDPHVDSSRVQVPIESFCFSFTVVQLPFLVLTGLFHQKCYLLKARVIIYAYNHHVRLLPPEPVVVKQPKFTRVEGVGIVMQSNRYKSAYKTLRFSTGLFKVRVASIVLL